MLSMLLFMYHEVIIVETNINFYNFKHLGFKIKRLMKYYYSIVPKLYFRSSSSTFDFDYHRLSRNLTKIYVFEIKFGTSFLLLPSSSFFSPSHDRNLGQKELCKLYDGQRTETGRPKRVEALNFKLKLMRLKRDGNFV